MVGDLCGCNVQLDGVVGLNDWIWVTDGAAIVCYQEWNVFSTQLYFLDFAQLVLHIGKETREDKRKNTRTHVLVDTLADVI